MIAVRGLPGAGMKYISTLLSNYYHSNDVMYYDSNFNEYFHNAHLDQNKNGRIEQSFWDKNKWVTISGNPKENSIIMQEHDIEHGKKFRQFRKSNGRVGLDPKKFIQSMNECYFIYCDEKKELDFIQKLIFIKSKGYRPIIVYDNETNISSEQMSKSAVNLRMITSLVGGNMPPMLINKVQEKISYKDWINIWKEYCTFIQQFPYSFPLSYDNLNYIFYWLEENMSWNLYDTNMYMSYIQECMKVASGRKYTEFFDIELEKSKLVRARQIQKENGMILHEIKYSDLFFDQKSTDTILDSYLDDIKAYTKKNIKVIQEYENFYGEIIFN